MSVCIPLSIFVFLLGFELGKWGARRKPRYVPDADPHCLSTGVVCADCTDRECERDPDGKEPTC